MTETSGQQRASFADEHSQAWLLALRADGPVRDAAVGRLHALLLTRELLGAIRRAVQTELTPHQRDVFTALALNGVPIDVLAERLTTTRGALYKTLHDARRKLRARLADSGLAAQEFEEASNE